MNEPTRCPFCGSIPDTDDEGVDLETGDEGEVTHACLNTRCPIYGAPVEHSLWNRRAESPDLAATLKLVRDLFELALEWKAEDCAFKDPGARYMELKQRAIELGLLEGSKV